MSDSSQTFIFIDESGMAHVINTDGKCASRLIASFDIDKRTVETADSEGYVDGRFDLHLAHQ